MELIVASQLINNSTNPPIPLNPTNMFIEEEEGPFPTNERSDRGWSQSRLSHLGYSLGSILTNPPLLYQAVCSIVKTYVLPSKRSLDDLPA